MGCCAAVARDPPVRTAAQRPAGHRHRRTPSIGNLSARNGALTNVSNASARNDIRGAPPALHAAVVPTAWPDTRPQDKLALEPPQRLLICQRVQHIDERRMLEQQNMHSQLQQQLRRHWQEQFQRQQCRGCHSFSIEPGEGVRDLGGVGAWAARASTAVGLATVKLDLRVMRISGDVACIIPGLDGRLTVGRAKALIASIVGSPVDSQRWLQDASILSDSTPLAELETHSEPESCAEVVVTLVITHGAS